MLIFFRMARITFVILFVILLTVQLGSSYKDKSSKKYSKHDKSGERHNKYRNSRSISNSEESCKQGNQDEQRYISKRAKKQESQCDCVGENSNRFVVEAEEPIQKRSSEKRSTKDVEKKDGKQKPLDDNGEKNEGAIKKLKNEEPKRKVKKELKEKRLKSEEPQVKRKKMPIVEEDTEEEAEEYSSKVKPKRKEDNIDVDNEEFSEENYDENVLEDESEDRY